MDFDKKKKKKRKEKQKQKEKKTSKHWMIENDLEFWKKMTQNF